ncbi:MAG: DNA pilot protein [Microviridae sp.]|nr:MAG: DNA pilot protein [Microviridae sp.]
MVLLQIATSTALLIGSILAALSAAGGTAAAAISRKKSEDRQNRYNMDAEQRQSDYMDEQNEYNSPASQMRRYADAGLNPYLVDATAGNQDSAVGVIGNQAQDTSDILQAGITQTGQSVADGVSRFQSAMLDEKKYNLDVAKLDFQRTELEEKQRQFEKKMAFDREGFDRLKKRDEIEDAYRASRDEITDEYNQKILAIRQSELDFDKQKEATRALESQRDYELRALDSYRRGQIHSLQVHALETENQYNDDALELFKKYEMPTKQAQFIYDKVIAELGTKMNSFTQAELDDMKQRLRQQMRLASLLADNRISEENYKKEVYNTWNVKHTNIFGKFDDSYGKPGYGEEFNPYIGKGGWSSDYLNAMRFMSESFSRMGK